MKAAQQHNKQHHNGQVREQMPSRACQVIYVDHPPLYISNAKEMAMDAYSKLAPPYLGPHHAILMISTSVESDQEEIPNAISSDHLQLASNSTEPQEDMVDHKQQIPPTSTPSRSPTEVYDQLGQGTDKGVPPREYSIYFIKKHIGYSRQRKDVEWWCRYASQDDTIKLAEHILRHFFNRYWKMWNKDNRNHINGQKV